MTEPNYADGWNEARSELLPMLDQLKARAEKAEAALAEAEQKGASRTIKRVRAVLRLIQPDHITAEGVRQFDRVFVEIEALDRAAQIGVQP